MSKAEKFISDCTRNCSNYTGVINKKTYEGYYVPWLTPDQARKAVEIAREERLNEICEWIGKQEDLLEDSFSDPNDFADILKQEITNAKVNV